MLDASLHADDRGLDLCRCVYRAEVNDWRPGREKFGPVCLHSVLPSFEAMVACRAAR
jgi:hypothetical protein